MLQKPVVLLITDEGRALVKRKCKAAGLSLSIVEDLIAAEIAQQGKMCRAGLWDEFDHVLDGALSDEGE